MAGSRLSRGKLRRGLYVAAAGLLACLTAACEHAALDVQVAEDDAGAAPEAAPPPRDAPRAPVRAVRHMIVAANPLAAEAGRSILRAGGSAVDAAIAAEMVLNLVEPQSSGIGGGGFLVHFAAASGAVETYDGRETAPASAHARMLLDDEGRRRSFDDLVAGGLSVGVPGLVRMLEMAHRAHGRLPWARLFEPAIRLAEDGFDVSPRLASALAHDKHLKGFPEAAAYFFDATGAPRRRLANPALADTLRQIAARGADAFYRGPVAADIARAVAAAPRNPAVLSEDDLAAYRAARREPVCSLYRVYFLCGMGPPSSGGIATLQILGLLEARALDTMAPLSAEAVHLIAEASRLAYADRSLYVADPDFVDVPVERLIDHGYLEDRAKLISPDRAMERAQAGDAGGPRGALAPDADEAGVSTSHLSIVDEAGNAVALTSSIESVFGSRLLVRGFLLNNQMTDFATAPEGARATVANVAAPGKRPRSSMAPTLVFDGAGRLVLAAGSPGGSRIIGYVANALIAVLDWGLDPQAAAALPHFGNRNGATELEKGTEAARLKPRLDALGHRVALEEMASGLHLIRRQDDVLLGGADPRREGVARGD